MNARGILPSAQFSLIVFSIFFSVGLVYAARFISTPPQPGALASVTSNTTPAPPNTASSPNWEATLYEIQAEQGGSQASAEQTSGTNPPGAATTTTQNPNLTATIGQTILADVSSAYNQGLSSDVGAQSQAVADAMGQIHSGDQATVYAKSDLTITQDSTTTLKAYGNALAQLLVEHADSNDYPKTLLAIGAAADNNDSTKLGQLRAVADDYHALVEQLIKTPTPQTLVPFHLQAINDISAIESTYPDIEQLLTDPIRGMSGVEAYQSLNSEVGQVFTNIAQALGKDAILFNNDEPGALWASFLSQQSSS